MYRGYTIRGFIAAVRLREVLDSLIPRFVSGTKWRDYTNPGII